MQLTVDQIVVSRGDRRIIDGLSFDLPGATALILTGPNGAGKTTLIRTIAGFLTPLAGTIRLTSQGASNPTIDADDDTEIAERCHYVGHANGTKSNLTVAENLSFWSNFLNPQDDADARIRNTQTALEHFELSDLGDIPAGYLSAGQKRRLGLARLLVCDRPLWLLDEPTVSLDTRSTGLLANAVKTHVANGGIAIAATHVPLGLDGARQLHLEHAGVAR